MSRNIIENIYVGAVLAVAGVTATTGVYFGAGTVEGLITTSSLECRVESINRIAIERQDESVREVIGVAIDAVCEDGAERTFMDALGAKVRNTASRDAEKYYYQPLAIGNGETYLFKFRNRGHLKNWLSADPVLSDNWFNRLVTLPMLHPR